MPNIKFLTVKQIDSRYKKYKDAIGFTDKENIYFNLFYPEIFEEYDIERALNYVFTHELIHSIDMRISEKRVTNLGDVVQDSLIKMGLSKE